jgi:DNA-binding IclR family transcriptional regulator
MKFNSSKLATMPRTLAGHLVLAELQAEARRERFAASFDQHFADDDVPSVPNPMDSAQSRRAQGVAL